MHLPPGLEGHPTRKRAQLAYLQGIEALSRHPEARDAHIHWLRRQTPVAMNDEGWILLVYPTETEARLAEANEAMVRLGHRLRAIEAAQGVVALAVAGANGAAGSANGGKARKRPAHQEKRQPWERQPVYMPAFLVKTTLPHREPKDSRFLRVNGQDRTSLFTDRSIGLPFGVYPRLIVIELATRAVRTKSRTYVIGRSINEMLTRMGISNRGGRDGQATLARDQLDRLCWAKFVTSHLSKYKPTALNVADRWLEKTSNGLEVTLTERFFEQATKSAVPLDPFILRKLRRSPLSIDIYGWITYRLSTLEEPTAISWASVERQFGSEYKNPRQFRWKFRLAVERLRSVWPGELSIDIQERRVVLSPGPPSVASRTERHNAKHH